MNYHFFPKYQKKQKKTPVIKVNINFRKENLFWRLLHWRYSSLEIKDRQDLKKVQLQNLSRIIDFYKNVILSSRKFMT